MIVWHVACVWDNEDDDDDYDIFGKVYFNFGKQYKQFSYVMGIKHFYVTWMNLNLQKLNILIKKSYNCSVLCVCVLMYKFILLIHFLIFIFKVLKNMFEIN